MEESVQRNLERTRKALMRKLALWEGFVRGSVVLMKRRCTYPGCRKCAAGQGHPTWVLTVSRHGKTRTIYLGARRRDPAQRMTESYRRLLGLIEEIAEVNLALLTGKPLEGKGGRDGPQRLGT
jgi:hypothetical protein